MNNFLSKVLLSGDADGFLKITLKSRSCSHDEINVIVSASNEYSVPLYSGGGTDQVVLRKTLYSTDIDDDELLRIATHLAKEAISILEKRSSHDSEDD